MEIIENPNFYIAKSYHDTADSPAIYYKITGRGYSNFFIQWYSPSSGKVESDSMPQEEFFRKLKSGKFILKGDIYPYIGKFFTAKGDKHSVTYKVSSITESENINIEWISASGRNESIQESANVFINKLINGEYVIKTEVEEPSSKEIKVGDLVRMPMSKGSLSKYDRFYTEADLLPEQRGLIKHGSIIPDPLNDLGEVIWVGAKNYYDREFFKISIVRYTDRDGKTVQVGFDNNDLEIVGRAGEINNTENLITNKIAQNGTKGIEVFKVTATIAEGKRISGSGISGKRGIATIGVGHLSNKEIIGF